MPPISRSSSLATLLPQCCLALLTGISIFALSLLPLSAEVQVFNRENTLGTTMEVKVVCRSERDAKAAYESMLKKLNHLNSVFNHRLPDSEAAHLHLGAAGKPKRVSQDMARVLSISMNGNRLSKGRYSIFSGGLSKLWKEAEKSKKMPSPESLKRECERIAHADKQMRLDAKRRVLAAPLELPVDLDSLAKGYIIDQCLASLMKSEGVTAALVNIGGDIAVKGRNYRWKIDISSPSATDALEPINLSSGAVATSGAQYRYFTIAGKKYSHLIDASTGEPVHDDSSATVMSSKAVFADMFATMASLNSATASVKMINSLKGTECILIDADGKKHMSSHWTSLTKQSTQSLVRRGKSSEQVKISWCQTYARKTNQKHRHFTVVWVENEKGEKVRDLVLWYKGRKAKYLRKFRTWWNKGGGELLKNTKILKNISSASKRKGNYDVVWDHKDNEGASLSPGIYYIHIAVNREHGPNKETPSESKIKIDTRKSRVKEKGDSQPELEKITVESI